MADFKITTGGMAAAPAASRPIVQTKPHGLQSASTSRPLWLHVGASAAFGLVLAGVGVWIGRGAEDGWHRLASQLMIWLGLGGPALAAAVVYGLSLLALRVASVERVIGFYLGGVRVTYSEGAPLFLAWEELSDVQASRDRMMMRFDSCELEVEANSFEFRDQFDLAVKTARQKLDPNRQLRSLRAA